MAEYIEREAISFPANAKPNANGEFSDFDCGYNSCLSKMKTRIANTPAADVAPVRHGRWVWDNYLYDFSCSVCGDSPNFAIHLGEDAFMKPTKKYCPNCGAKMEMDE